MRPPRALIHASKPSRPTRAASVPSKTSESESFSSSANSTSALLEIPRKSQKNDEKASSQKKAMIRRVFSHALLIGFLALVLVPYIMVVSASFRRGNFAPNSLLPDHYSLEHWKYVLGIPYEEVINPATGEKRMVEAET